MRLLLFLILFVFNFINYLYPQSHKILESTSEFIKIEFNFEGSYQIKEKLIDGNNFHYIEGKEFNVRNTGEPWLPNYLLNIGIPYNTNPVVRILDFMQERIQNIFILPTPDSLTQPFSLLPFNKDIYDSYSFFPGAAAMVEDDFIMRYARVLTLSVSPYQTNPVSRELIFNKKIIVQVDFKIDQQDDRIINPINDKMTLDLLKSSVINYDYAKEFMGKVVTASEKTGDTYWYNPAKDYYKIYLNEKGVYRVTYEMLINAGLPVSGIQEMKFELFNNEFSVPIDVVDVNNDGFFNEGDYFQFVGRPAKPHDQFTRMNIYNTSNIYWFSYQADSLNYYKSRNGFPSGNSPNIINSVKTLLWEEDKSYQRFGHATTDQRDYWYWGSAEAVNGAPTYRFEYFVEDSLWVDFVSEKPQVKIKVGLHGLTTGSCPSQKGHNSTIFFNYKPVGSINWNGQSSALFEKDFYLAFYTFGGGDTAQLYWNMNQNVTVMQNGDICSDTTTDISLINYIEFQYWRWHRVNSNYFYFTSPPNDYGENIYYLFQWLSNNMKVYIPSRGELIANPLITNDADLSVRFQDTVSVQTDYYCVADDYYMLPDSIIKEVSFSDLKNTANGADYIIISHPKFRSAADRLANFRSDNLEGFTSPRVEVVNIFDIYKEFSGGLLNPFALRDFAKYAFENWQEPAPKYIVLLGDASYDYRGIFPTSKPNYIPSIPFHGILFGQLPSDNSITMVAGNDNFPDIAIGRLASETLEEANTLVDKIITYPIDNSKQWKENAILLASGLNYQDQVALGFNNRAKELENAHLIPNGITATKVFNFPEPHDIAFYGGGPRMRQEINKGAALVSYYGHGGGSQWDLIFTKDDIPELTNAGRLPFVTSVTCYTAHFENAESFGELFTKIPNKGAIGFWGSVSLTWWPSGHNLNMKLFESIFTNKNYVTGTAILNAMATGQGSIMIPQIAYLGDPGLELIIPKAPDFEVRSSEISISPQYPLKEDTVSVSIGIRNWGITFPGDSVTVELFKDVIDSGNLIGEIKLPSFGYNMVTNIIWIPEEAGLYNLIVRINEKDIIEELDHSDNIASRTFSVFDFGKPNIIKPQNGFFSEEDKIDFVLADIGFYFDRDFNYLIQINSSQEFDNGSVLMQSPILSPQDGVVKWLSGSLQPGEYFWRAIIYDQIDTNFSDIGIFSITNQPGFGYMSVKKQLQKFDMDNMNYSDDCGCLVLNTELKPPHPEDKFLLDSIFIDLPSDSTWPATFTTDGSYFYFANLTEWVDESKIYKIGTGLNGTIKGQNYGAIPDGQGGDLLVSIYSHMFSKDGYLYTSTGPTDNLLIINPQNGDTSRVQLSDSLLLTQDGPSQIGGCYFYYDGTYLYNLAMGTLEYPDKFVLRTFNPSENWSRVGNDVIFSGNLVRNITSFIVIEGYVIIYENLFASHLRRYRLSDGVYEEEWAYASPSRGYYAIAYDYQNNFVYFSLFTPAGEYQPGFIKYSGTYIEANGSLISQEIGPASKWYNLEFDIDQTNSNGIYKTYLHGKNSSTDAWNVLDTLTQSTFSLDGVNVKEYNFLKLSFELVDSSFGAGQPMKFNSLKVNYEYLPEISLTPREMTFAPDSMLQGYDVQMNLKVNNIGYVKVDSLKLDFYFNEGDTVFFSRYITVLPDSFNTVEHTFKTNNIIFNNNVRTVVTSPIKEYYTFNNLTEGGFFVARDSTKPTFNITFDGREILNGDIISANPEILISLKDNSPLPMDTTLFTIVHTHRNQISILNFSSPEVEYSYTRYPNSEFTVKWNPIFTDGQHSIEVLAKDASGNFFDTTSHRTVFFVYNDSDIRDVYNYPNPFKDDTHFTFELRGVNVPEELRLRIYTVAGRLIREIPIYQSEIKLGFNKIHWDGRDQDGDEIANGLYFYKVIYRNDDVIKTVTQKLAKVK